MCAQTADLVPADKAMYALRDVTATVDDIALIASSIMSKKLAGGAGAILLDVKTGSGAFMKDLDDARELAELCVALGEDSGRATGALITDMSQPLADAVGNASEVREAIEVLRGERTGRFADVCLALAGHMAALAGLADGRRARRRAGARRRSRAARRSSASGASSRPRAAIRGSSTIPRCCPARRSATRSAPAATAGSQAVDAEAIGRAAAGVGAGRQRKEDAIDLGVGIDFLVRVGDEVGRRHASSRACWPSDEAAAEAAGREVLDALTWSEAPVDAPPLIHAVIGDRLA